MNDWDAVQELARMRGLEFSYTVCAIVGGTTYYEVLMHPLGMVGHYAARSKVPTDELPAAAAKLLQAWNATGLVP